MNEWLGLFGTLLGTTLGACLTWLVQRDARRHQEREALRSRSLDKVAAFLVTSHQVFRATADSLKETSDDAPHAEHLNRVAQATRDASLAAQVALEEVRLLCGAPVVQAAEDVWTHVRTRGLATAGSPSAKLRTWVDQYWNLRRRLVTAARADLNR